MKMQSKYWMVLIAACGMAASSLGVCFGTAGLFYSPVANDLGVGRGAVALTSTILSLVNSFGGMLVPKILKPKTMKPVIFAATLLMAGSTALFSLCPSLALIYILSAFRGFGMGLGNFVLVTMLINNWFRKAHGTFTSIAMTFSAVPGLFLSPVFTKVIQASGWRTGYLAVALSIVLFNLPALLLPISLRPQDSGMKAYGQEEYEQHLKENPGHLVTGRPISFSFISAEFFLAAAYTGMVCIAAQMTQHFPTLAESKGFSSDVGALLLSVSMAGSVVCKLIYGTVADRIGSPKTIMTVAGLAGIACALLIISSAVLPMQAGAFMYNFTAANSSIGIALIGSDLFGPQNYSKVYPVLNFVGSIIGAFSGTVIGLLYDATQSYNIVLTGIGIMQVLCIVCIFTVYRKINAREAE